MSEDPRSIELTRIAENHYRATAPNGASIEFGRGEGLMTPVELLLAADLVGQAEHDVGALRVRRIGGGFDDDRARAPGQGRCEDGHADGQGGDGTQGRRGGAGRAAGVRTHGSSVSPDRVVA